MSSKEIDDYLAALDEPKRSTLQELRRTIMEIVPEADDRDPSLRPRHPVTEIIGREAAGRSNRSGVRHQASWTLTGSRHATLVSPPFERAIAVAGRSPRKSGKRPLLGGPDRDLRVFWVKKTNLLYLVKSVFS